MRSLMIGICLAAGAGAALAATCESLASLTVPATGIVTAETVATGAFTPPTGPAIKELPGFCRVAGSIRPTSDSDIRFEVWMPASGWNGKFHGTGNGGFAGSLSYAGMSGPLRHGYATATTDTGHSSSDAGWALGHAEKIVDYGHRAIHEMTVAAKAIITAYYGSAPKKSYFASCSNGGRQALMEAQRYPADYDGIVSGAPVNDFTHTAAGFLWNANALTGEGHIPPAKMKAIETAGLAACDGADGVKDGLIEDPRRCRFDPGVLACTGAETDACLTAPQIAALRKVYSGPRNARGKQVHPGFVSGGESGAGGWGTWIAGTTTDKSLQYFFGTQMFRNMVANDPNWDYKTFDVTRDTPRLDKALAPVLNATDANLKPFVARGGKLILYHGWCDAALTPINTINYYQRAVAKMGSRMAAKSLRLYMLPGVQHCGGGPGPNRFVMNWTDATHDMLLALEQWVEGGPAPAVLVAAGGTPERTRPLCPYPQAAHYKGAGSVDDAANFTCSGR
jgi:hypothetical protein